MGCSLGSWPLPFVSYRIASRVPPNLAGSSDNTTYSGFQACPQRDISTGPNAGLTEVLIPAGYVTTVYDPVFSLSADGKRYVSTPSHTPTTIPEPGLPFSLVFRAEPGKEDVLLKVASAYEAASQRRVPPPNFGPL